MNPNYRYLLISLLCWLPIRSFAQRVYEGQVVNKVTEAPLKNATVALLKAKLAVATDDQGYYKLVVNKPVTNDTLQFSFVGYDTYLLPAANYQPKMFIPLTPANNRLKQVDIAGNKIKTLTLYKFNVSDIKDIRFELMTKDGLVRGGYYTTPVYTNGTFAKQFEAPQVNVKLNTIDLGRRDRDIPTSPEDYPLATSSKYMRFLIHVILPDSAGALGKTIFTKEVYISNGALKITIDLKDKQIIIPTTKFFIAVEWLPIRINEVIYLNVGRKTAGIKKDGSSQIEETAKYSILYQPFLVKFESAVGAVGWQSVDNRHWFKFDFRSPHPSRKHPNHDVALSATIVY
ncbi:carboxypeptidase-like regulatory domain-containing protein [Mucilaginibacter panaciglaebae]|uniref:Carboxypeptidase-like protein n=1 Tax=Mucilaginibacter panaciglaebae TaxID=502331 RepID=A0ABP7WCY5_9SPHI